MAVRAELLRRLAQNPVRAVPLAFLGAILAGAALLMLPAAHRGPGSASFLTALFTSTSAICTSGFAVVPTRDYWSPLGHILIMVLTQAGGFGIMTMATLLTLLVSRRLGLRNRLALQAEGARLGIGNARRVLVRIALVSLVCEAAAAVVVAARLWGTYDYPPWKAGWYGVFHAVQAFNNSGFSLFPDSVKPYVGDGWICLPLTLAVIVGATGFPVIFELLARWREPSRWSTHTRLTVLGSLILLAVGFAMVLAFEWRNPATLGPLDVRTKLLASFVQGAIPRSGGLNSVDYGSMRETTLAVITGLMFVGGGSASTAGGIKVTTFFLLAFVMLAELRGEPDVVIGRRRIAPSTQRLALTIALLGVALATASTLLLSGLTNGLPLYRELFETVSALSTAGITDGVTAVLPADGRMLLIVLMYLGRVGTVAAASALALRARPRLYRYAEERPLVG
ncbi:TrkH family potassium uptake protein [Plantactinospora siamensis]|uniref:TrkH family potassium uptake protein n=1 Tax=Plantactinospora siamensis TaxID=555372 RepID=A0ABV6NWI9_9ACTN